MLAKIAVQGLGYAIADTRILDNVCLQVLENRMVGIIGPNGSGKTTLLKHIYRALPAEKKTVFINTRVIEDYSFNESAKALTVVKQENPSDFDFTVMEMVLLGRAPYRSHFASFTQEDRAIADRCLASVGMSQYAERSFNALSGGEKQRVLIARSLAQSADIFILDEPTNHLDVHYQWSLMELIKSLQCTVLGVFHELNLAARFCDFLYVLDAGRIVAEGQPADVLTVSLLSKIFSVQAEIIPLEGGHPHIVFKRAITAAKAV